MPDRPNVLILMADQMVGRVLAPDHPCQTPNFDKLRDRGVRLTRAYTPNAVCSPARASLMTGRLPHSHGVMWVTHTITAPSGDLDPDLPHFAQRLRAAGYHTGYFGKWHAERSNDLNRFGWAVDGNQAPPDGTPKAGTKASDPIPGDYDPAGYLHEHPGPGYRHQVFWGVTDKPVEQRNVGRIAGRASGFLDDAFAGDQPWCCFVSCPEPHDPFICGREAFERYDVDAVEPPANWADGLAGRPGLYRRAAKVFAHLTEREKKEAAACYYASTTEIDEQYGRLIDKVEAAGQLDNTIVVMTSDHGELLGAHGLYLKNIGAFEETYEIPMVLAGPGVAAGPGAGDVEARVGLHDLGPTLLDLCGAEAIDTAGESRSFADLLREPAAHLDAWQTGFAEYTGGRLHITQRVVWDGDWKLVFNGFAGCDELYNLAADPGEMTNLLAAPGGVEDQRELGDLPADTRAAAERLYARMWQAIRDTDDHELANLHYPILRVAPLGPLTGV